MGCAAGGRGLAAEENPLLLEINQFRPTLDLVSRLVPLAVDKLAQGAHWDVALGIRAGARMDSRVSHDIDPALAAPRLAALALQFLGSGP